MTDPIPAPAQRSGPRTPSPGRRRRSMAAPRQAPNRTLPGGRTPSIHSPKASGPKPTAGSTRTPSGGSSIPPFSTIGTVSTTTTTTIDNPESGKRRRKPCGVSPEKGSKTPEIDGGRGARPVRKRVGWSRRGNRPCPGAGGAQNRRPRPRMWPTGPWAPFSTGRTFAPSAGERWRGVDDAWRSARPKPSPLGPAASGSIPAAAGPAVSAWPSAPPGRSTPPGIPPRVCWRRRGEEGRRIRTAHRRSFWC